MASKRNIRHKCPFCEKRMTREELVTHVAEVHDEVLPEDFTPLRYVFNYVNRKPIEYHGKCTECGRSTLWDENKGRYNRQCESPSCRRNFIKRFETNMLRTKGVTRITASADGLERMLAARNISGEYTMQDGTKKTYTGTYELKALEFMDKVMNIDSQDIMCPGPVLEYTFKGQTHLYITDFYYQPYNLIIEVKDGGDNPNRRNMPEYRAKQIAKEEYIIKNTKYNYLRLTNNNLEQLLSVFMNLKMQLVESTDERVIQVNESVEGDSQMKLMEVNGSLMGLPPVGLNSPDSVYVVNYMQNNVFSGEDINGYALADGPKLTRILTRDKLGKLKETSGVKFLSNCDFNLYLVTGVSEEALQEISDNIGQFVEEEFLYETIFNHKMFTYDQIACEENAQPVVDYYTYLETYRETVSEALEKKIFSK